MDRASLVAALVEAIEKLDQIHELQAEVYRTRLESALVEARCGRVANAMEVLWEITRVGQEDLHGAPETVGRVTDTPLEFYL